MLLVGFWFDGGLFNLPTAATFWILLELGAARINSGKDSLFQCSDCCKKDLREQWFILNHRSVTTRQNFIWGGLVILLFLGALGWARERDPFVRKWFTLKTSDRGSVKCVAVLPKPMRRYPVVIYAHGAGEDLLKDGVELRQMAELGLAAVSLEYDKTNETAFNAQFDQLLHYLNRQSWVNTNAIAWVGLSQGANDMLDFALQHPEQQPQLLVQLSGAGVEESAGKSKIPDANSTLSTFNVQPSTNLHCPVLLVHGEQDEVFPVADTKRLASALQTKGVQVEIKTIPGLPHGLEPERECHFPRSGRILPDAFGRKGCLAKLSFHCPVAGKSAIAVVMVAAGGDVGRWLVDLDCEVARKNSTRQNTIESR